MQTESCATGNHDYKICVVLKLNSKILGLRLRLESNRKLTQQGDGTDQKIMGETIKEGEIQP